MSTRTVTPRSDSFSFSIVARIASWKLSAEAEGAAAGAGALPLPPLAAAGAAATGAGVGAVASTAAGNSPRINLSNWAKTAASSLPSGMFSAPSDESMAAKACSSC